MSASEERANVVCSQTVCANHHLIEKIPVSATHLQTPTSNATYERRTLTAGKQFYSVYDVCTQSAHKKIQIKLSRAVTA